MQDLLEQFIVRIANGFLRGGDRKPTDGPGVLLGHVATDDGTPGPAVRLPHAVRTQHIATLGGTGTGKTSLIRVLISDDIRHTHGLVLIDLHGDTTPYVLDALATEEARRGVDLSGRVIVIDPSDPQWAFGLNVLEASSDAGRFIQLAEVALLLKQRWDLASFGPRTEELLRNALFVLSAAGLTLIELAPLLTDAAFRADALRNVANEDVRAYFRNRYDTASEPMQGVMRDAVLNKVTAFTADPHFRHILGQAQSGVSLVDALDRGAYILLNLPKGRLGEHAATLGSLFLSQLKRALFARRSRALVTVYADELQNLVEYTTGIDTMLAEARKFGVGFVTANQFLDQYPPAMRAAVMTVGTHIFFRLSAQDAERANALVDGGKHAHQLLKNLTTRHAILRRGGQPWQHFRVLAVEEPSHDSSDLLARVHRRWSRRREDVEHEIASRRSTAHNTVAAGGDLDDWS